MTRTNWSPANPGRFNTTSCEIIAGAIGANDACRARTRSLLNAPVRAAITWVENQIHAPGKEEFARADIEVVITRNVALRRQHGGSTLHRFTALTVQQAKNREFDGVVVVWPYQVGGNVEHKRRLLYNAMTRAKR